MVFQDPRHNNDYATLLNHQPVASGSRFRLDVGADEMESDTDEELRFDGDHDDDDDDNVYGIGKASLVRSTANPGEYVVKAFRMSAS